METIHNKNEVLNKMKSAQDKVFNGQELTDQDKALLEYSMKFGIEIGANEYFKDQNLKIIQEKNLPISELKEHGILLENNEFSREFDIRDLRDLLNGKVLTVEKILSEKMKFEINLQLVDNYSRLKVEYIERERVLNELLEESKNEIKYSESNEFDPYTGKYTSFSKSVFIYDQNTKTTKMYDIVQNRKELSEYFRNSKDPIEKSKYNQELLKMMSYLQTKIEMYPEIAKDIQKSLNIIKVEANSFSVESQTTENLKTSKKSKIDLDVNDYDRYQDANRNREIEEKEEKQEISSGRKR
ncbi:MAG: hypothetical protein WDA08_11180 [Weeksellaceae bacterium]|nr:hypothetical protein [Acholeplasmataceae bacterium]